MRAIEPIPDAMQAAVLHAYDGAPESLRVETRPVPQPRDGQVLVKMSASPINPSDLMFLKGLYGVLKPLPVVPGWEGAGRVVATGEDWLSRRLLGKRVACAAPNQHDGTWAEYMLTAALRCIPLQPSVSDEQGATLIVNPLTAWALMDLVRKAGARAFVQTAAASAVGRMLVRLSQRFSVEGIHIVRRPEQAELLRSMGATHVLNSETPDFDAQLKELAHRLNATIAIEAVSGMTAARVLNAMPANSRLILYGALSESPLMADPRDLIFQNKRIEGFWLADWLAKRSAVGQLRLANQIQKALGDLLHTDIAARYPLREIHHALADYQASMTAGKRLIVFQQV
ncbi:MAG: zinc-binding dehydrogenase [Fimbriimonadales bacterium]|nr:zinc-binding dehydrogenase [Fimbriimonadales bacterium]